MSGMCNPGVRPHAAPQTHRRAARRPVPPPHLQPAGAVGTQLQEVELQPTDTTEPCEKPVWGTDTGGRTSPFSPREGRGGGPAPPSLPVPAAGRARRTRRQGWQGCEGRHRRALLSARAGGFSGGGPGRAGQRQRGRLSVLSAVGGGKSRERRPCAGGPTDRRHREPPGPGVLGRGGEAPGKGETRRLGVSGGGSSAHREPRRRGVLGRGEPWEGGDPGRGELCTSGPLGTGSPQKEGSPGTRSPGQRGSPEPPSPCRTR